MNDYQRRAILAVKELPTGGRWLPLDDFSTVAALGDEYPSVWALRELHDALRRHNSDDIYLTLEVGRAFGFDDTWAGALLAVLTSEGVVNRQLALDAVADIGGDAALAALEHVAGLGTSGSMA